MNRRSYLERTAALLAAGGLAGCVGGAPDPGGAPLTDGTPSTPEQEFTVLRSGCGNEANTADVSLDDEAGTVTVTGTITGSDACKTAILQEATVDDGSFEVVVATEDEEGAEVCAQCLTEIEYEATFTFADGLPEEVFVVHESLGERRTVAGAGTGSATQPETTESETATAGERTLADASLRVDSQGCGRGANEASVEFDDEVTVTGTIAGSDTCKTAELREATYDAEGDELRVVVGTRDDTPEGETSVCGDCIVDIEYTVTAQFTGGVPSSVTVVHESAGGTETVATATA